MLPHQVSEAEAGVRKVIGWVGAMAASLIASAALAQGAPAPAAAGSETPEHFTPVTSGFDYERREAMVPMRDGTRLKTVIWIPKGADGALVHGAPILLTRTPYNASDRGSSQPSAHLAAVIGETDAAAPWSPRTAISGCCRTCAASTARRAPI